MNVDCTAQQYLFQAPGRRQVVAAFDGGTITSDGGAVLLPQVDDLSRLLRDFAACFHDARDPDQIEHTVEDLLR
ncbi:MAG: transposase [Acidobacteria bacterium]|nr:transposase [Acidobacteriota bacterium]